MRIKFSFALILGVLLTIPSCKDELEPIGSIEEENPGETEMPYTGTISGHKYVDLGLPSGTLWATCNVGASIPEERGDNFAWGETQPKDIYTWDNLKYFTDSVFSFINSYGDELYTHNFSKYTTFDQKYILDPEDDAATANWGSDWRMPTRWEARELSEQCQTTYPVYHGVRGTLVTGPNGNSIFFHETPEMGFPYRPTYLNSEFWTSEVTHSRLDDFSTATSYVPFSGHGPEGEVAGGRSSCRYLGKAVRPVVANKILSLHAPHGYIGHQGGEIVITVTTDETWTASCNQPWVRLSTSTGNGNGSITASVAANEAISPDSAVIQVSCEKVTRFVRISRAGNKKSGFSFAGHEYVALGLPSGTLWASCNVGAYSPEQFGDWFTWGDTQAVEPYDYYYSYLDKKDLRYIRFSYDSVSTDSYPFTCSWSESKLPWITISKYNVRDGKTVLDPEDDAATVNWGSDWRTPTKEEADELYNACTKSEYTLNGVNGWLFVGPNGSSIFIAGQLSWTSTLATIGWLHPWQDAELIEGIYSFRGHPYPVRPVVNH